MRIALTRLAQPPVAISEPFFIGGADGVVDSQDAALPGATPLAVPARLALQELADQPNRRGNHMKSVTVGYLATREKHLTPDGLVLLDAKRSERNTRRKAFKKARKANR